MGERDVVKAAFFQRGDVSFYKVAMQPGMPQGFGHIEGKPYFGLPGNPVSVFVSFELFVRPALLKMMGRSQVSRPEITARLTQDVTGPKGKMQFARVVVARGSDGWKATPTGARGSNLISTVSRANGLAMIPPGVETGAGGLAGARHALPRCGGLSAVAGPSQAGADGVTRIVEVGEKAETAREAIAECFVSMEPEAVRHLLAGTKKGDPIATAKVAGVIGVKETPRLLPHCHPIRVTGRRHRDRGGCRRGVAARDGDRASDGPHRAWRWRR